MTNGLNGDGESQPCRLLYKDAVVYSEIWSDHLKPGPGLPGPET